MTELLRIKLCKEKWERHFKTAIFCGKVFSDDVPCRVLAALPSCRSGAAAERQSAPLRRQKSADRCVWRCANTIKDCKHKEARFQRFNCVHYF